MQIGKKYIVQLCEVNKETLNKTKQEKDEIFKTSNGIFQNDDIFLNHESILVTPTRVRGIVRECITGKEIPIVTLEIYKNFDKKMPNIASPYAYYVNSNFKSSLFAFQIIYYGMGYKIENATYNRVLVSENEKYPTKISEREEERKAIADFVHSKNMSLSEYREYLNNRLALLEERKTRTLGQSLKRVMNLHHKKK